MTGKIRAHVKDYPGGKNAVFEEDDRAVSVVRTDVGGWFEVQGDDGQIKYTGQDPEAAAKATIDYLKKGK